MPKQLVKVEFFKIGFDFALKISLVEACAGPVVFVYATTDYHAAMNLRTRGYL